MTLLLFKLSVTTLVVAAVIEFVNDLACENPKWDGSRWSVYIAKISVVGLVISVVLSVILLLRFLWCIIPSP